MREENVNHFEGPIIANPLKEASQGTQINIEQGVFVPNDPPGAYKIDNLAHYDGALLSVHFKGNTWSTAEGSAVMIAPGIALAAAHVIEPLKEEILRKGLRPFCVGLTSSGPRIWKIRHVARVFQTDVVVLSLDYASPIPPDGRFVQVMTTTRLPEIGELIMVSGFRASAEHIRNAEYPYFPIENEKIKYAVDLWVGVGLITQKYVNGLDARLPGPTLEVACATDGGMSGGPAFDKSGRLVGILSTSMHHDDGIGTSRISLVVPSLITPITPPKFLNVYDEFGSGTFKLLNLPSCLCGIEGREAIREELDPETGNISLEIESWAD